MTNNIAKKVIVLGVAALFTGAVLPVYAVGLAVTPAELTIQAQVNKETSVRVKIGNPSNDVALVELYPESAESILKVTPASFTLQAGEERYAEVKVKSGEVGKIDINLSVIARPLVKGELSAGSGIKIPIHIETIQSSGWRSLTANMASLFTNTNILVPIVFLLAGLAAGYFLKKREG